MKYLVNHMAQAVKHITALVLLLGSCSLYSSNYPKGNGLVYNPKLTIIPRLTGRPLHYMEWQKLCHLPSVKTTDGQVKDFMALHEAIHEYLMRNQTLSERKKWEHINKLHDEFFRQNSDASTDFCKEELYGLIKDNSGKTASELVLRAITTPHGRASLGRFGVGAFIFNSVMPYVAQESQKRLLGAYRDQIEQGIDDSCYQVDDALLCGGIKCYTLIEAEAHRNHNASQERQANEHRRHAVRFMKAKKMAQSPLLCRGFALTVFCSGWQADEAEGWVDPEQIISLPGIHMQKQLRKEQCDVNKNVDQMVAGWQREVVKHPIKSFAHTRKRLPDPFKEPATRCTIL